MLQFTPLTPFSWQQKRNSVVCFSVTRVQLNSCEIFFFGGKPFSGGKKTCLRYHRLFFEIVSFRKERTFEDMFSALLVLALAASSAWAVPTNETIQLQLELYYTGGDCTNVTFPDPSGMCVLSQQYWGTNNDQASQPENAIEWPIDALNEPDCYDHFRSVVLGYTDGFELLDESGYNTFDTGVYSVVNKPFFLTGSVAPIQIISPTDPTGYYSETGWCFVMAREYMSTLLNFCVNSCTGYGGQTSPAWQAMNATAYYLFDPAQDCQNDPFAHYNVSAEMANAYSVLHEYNTGMWAIVDGQCAQKYGPPLCAVDPSNVTECYVPPDDGDTCEGGCTLSHGYYKNHRLSAKRKKTEPWNEVCPISFLETVDGITCTASSCSPFLEQIPFSPYMPALTWSGVLDSPPTRGEACIIAGRQLIAAELNRNCINACVTSTIVSAINEVKEIMIAECVDLVVITPKRGAPTYENGLGSSSNSSAMRRRLLFLADYLDNYNTGMGVGPGSCESASSDNPAVAEASCDGSSASASAESSNGWAMASGIMLIFILAWKVVAACWSLNDGSSYSGLPDSRLGRAIVLGSAPMPQQQHQQGNRRAHAGNISDY
jgi:hypothetical protein